MRVLWASHFVPYPPKTGQHGRSYHLLRRIAAKHEVDLIASQQEHWLRELASGRWLVCGTRCASSTPTA
jgi:polysaccharide biosynthesis protein PslH